MSHPTDYQWETCPGAARFLSTTLDRLVAGNKFAKHVAQRFLPETGTRFFDWIDHVTIQDDQRDTLTDLGFEESGDVWRNPRGLFPAVRIGEKHTIAVKVDSVIDFAAKHQLKDACKLEGSEGGQFMSATVEDDVNFVALERHGFQGFDVSENSVEQITTAGDFYAAISQRKRNGIASESDDFAEASLMLSDVSLEIGMDWACDIFFRAEREYWMGRNLAARIQKERQDKLGVGWANHDHHTYRSSREHFARLIRVLELMGFQCRERFFAGEQAGWGAQVLEHPVCGIVIFADVDMTPEEVSGDFAHEGLAGRTELGTVGLWCKLHGESFLQAGLHHLECQFDFDAAREQLAACGINSMAPFTDFEHLRQAFTEGERWPVEQSRLDWLVEAGSISREQAETFASEGAIGSHLEILERNDGYKGFNQTGISHIITETDPRNR